MTLPSAPFSLLGPSFVRPPRIAPFGDERVSTWTPGAQAEPAAAPLSGRNRGDYVVVWSSAGQDGSGTGIYAQRFEANGTKAGLEIPVSGATTDRYAGPAVTGLIDGGFLVAWQTPGDAGGDLRAQRFDDRGHAVGDAFRLEHDGVFAPAGLSLLPRSNGDLLATYTALVARTDGGGWQPVWVAQPLSADGTPTGPAATTPVDDQRIALQTAVLVDGSLAVAWTDRGNRIVVHWVSKLGADGAPEGDPIRIDSGAPGSTTGLAALTDGGFVAVWNDGAQIWARTFDADGSRRGSPVAVSYGSPSVEAGATPQVVARADGGFDVAWAVRSNDLGIVAWALDVRGFNALAQPTGDVMRVPGEAVGGYGLQGYIDFDLVALHGRRLVVTWAGPELWTLGVRESDIYQALFASPGLPSRTEAPVLGGLPASVAFDEADVHQQPRLLWPDATVRDADSSDFLNGRLFVGLLHGAGDPVLDGRPPVDPHPDRLGLMEAGNGPGQVGIDGSAVTVGGVTVGRIVRAGADGDALEIKFNADATADAVQAVMRSVTFANRSESPRESRSIGVLLTDGDGGASATRIVDVHVAPDPGVPLPVFGVERTNVRIESGQEEPAGAAGGDGSFLLAWSSYRHHGELSRTIQARRFAEDGTPVGMEFSLQGVSGLQQSAPAVAALREGGFIVGWEEQRSFNSPESLVAQRVDSDGRPVGDRVVIADGRAGAQTSLALASRPDGGFVATWFDSSGKADVRARLFDGDVQPLGPSFQANTSFSFGHLPQERPRVAVGPDGGFVIVWQTSRQDGDDLGVFGQRFDASGQRAGAEFQVNTTTYQMQYDPEVAVLADGSFVVAWASYTAYWGTFDVFARHYGSDGTPLTDEFRLNADLLDHQMQPTVVALASGGYAVAWTDNELPFVAGWSKSGVVVRYFDAQGRPVDGEWRVDQGRHRYGADNPVSIALPDGALVLAWEDPIAANTRDIFHRLLHPDTHFTRPDPPQLLDLATEVSLAQDDVSRAPVLIDSDVRVVLSGPGTFAGGVFEAVVLDHGGVAVPPAVPVREALGLQEGGEGNAQLRIEGGDVFVGVRHVGTLAADGSDGRLTIHLADGATVSVVERLVEHLTYFYDAENPQPVREIGIALGGVPGALGTASQVVKLHIGVSGDVPGQRFTLRDDGALQWLPDSDGHVGGPNAWDIDRPRALSTADGHAGRVAVSDDVAMASPLAPPCADAQLAAWWDVASGLADDLLEANPAGPTAWSGGPPNTHWGWI